MNKDIKAINEKVVKASKFIDTLKDEIHKYRLFQQVILVFAYGIRIFSVLKKSFQYTPA